MGNEKWQDSDVWLNMDPKKKMIISKLAEQGKGKRFQDSAGIVMAAVNQMNREGLSFTKEESSVMIAALTENMSAADKAKVEMMKRFVK